MFHFSIKLLEGACRVPTMHQQQSEQSCRPATAQLITLFEHYFYLRHATAAARQRAAQLYP
jgi:hypothetical protein